MFKRLQNTYGKVALAGMVLAGLSLLLMMVYGFIDVTMRNLFNNPLPGTVEFTELFMPILALMGVAACQIQRRHMRVDFLFGFMSAKVKTIVNIFSYTAGIVAFSFVFWLSFLHALDSFHGKEVAWGVIPFPLYVAKFAVAVGILLFVLQLVLDFTNSTMELRKSGVKLPAVNNQ